MPLALSARIKIVQTYYAEAHSLTRTWRALRREEDLRRGLSKWAIRRLINKFERTGSVRWASKRRRTPSSAHERAVVDVTNALSAGEPNSTRRLSRGTNVPRTTVQRILHQELHLYPYKIQLVHQLKRGDKAQRLAFCHWLLSSCETDPLFLQNLIMSDEAKFHLDGVVNKANCRVWSTENPHVSVERVQFAPSITVWCGVSAKAILGPFFFEEGTHPVTVTAVRYRQMVTEFLLPQLQRHKMARSAVWFQQDRATPHTALATLTLLEAKFADRVISKGAEVSWPPRSPDLTAPDFFLWGYVKAKVYETQPKTLVELKSRIVNAVRSVSSQLRTKVILEAFPQRCKDCIRYRGGQLDNVVF